MEYSPTFLRLRAIAFMCITALCMTWAILLCLIMNWRWELSNTPFRSMLIFLLLANVITPIMLPILMVVLFRPWLDAARFLLLLIAHIGSAIMFAYWSPTFECSDNINDEAQCLLLNIFISVGSWVVPFFLLVYLTGLAFMLYRRSLHLLSAPQSMPVHRGDDVENIPPMLSLPDVYLSTPFTLTFPTSVSGPPEEWENWEAWRRYSSMGPGPSTFRMSQRLSASN